MKRFVMLVLLFCGCGFPFEGWSQQKGARPSYLQFYNDPQYGRFFYHAGAGLNLYTGDLAKPSQLGKQRMGFNPQLTLGTVYQLTNYIGIRGDLSYGLLHAQSAEDQWGDRSFNGSYFLGAVLLEHQFFPQISFDRLKTRINFYGFIGLGYLSFSANSEAEIPTATEDYSTTAMAFPMGLGMKYNWQEWLTLSLEMNYKGTTTDYLDDASTGSKPNDGIFTYQLIGRFRLFKQYKHNRFLNSRKKIGFGGD